MSKVGFSVFLLSCTIFGWGFAAAINGPALANPPVVSDDAP
ncbi:MAG: hypothetical protein ABL973_00870 [Micropepsaceae bacterium]